MTASLSITLSLVYLHSDSSDQLTLWLCTMDHTDIPSLKLLLTDGSSGEPSEDMFEVRSYSRLGSMNSFLCKVHRFTSPLTYYRSSLLAPCFSQNHPCALPAPSLSLPWTVHFIWSCKIWWQLSLSMWPSRWSLSDIRRWPSGSWAASLQMRETRKKERSKGEWVKMEKQGGWQDKAHERKRNILWEGQRGKT